MDIRIASISETHVRSLHACLDSVARERRFLAFLKAPGEDTFRGFVADSISRGAPFFVALESDTVVGWCDVNPRRYEGFTHMGKLGMGVRRDFRGKGVGTRLIAPALDRARGKNLERIELEVFASNTHAVALYHKFGFTAEGVRRKARKIDGEYDDIVFMALLFTGHDSED